MLKCFDYQCPACDKKQERFVHKDAVDSQYCDACHHPMQRNVPNPSGSGNAAHGYMAKVKGGGHFK